MFTSFMPSRRRSLRITLSNQLSNNEVLLQEALLPRLQVLQLILIQILQLIQRRRQILSQHLLIEALVSQTAGCVAASKVLVRTALLKPCIVSVCPASDLDLALVLYF